jgi:hypothetical protein
VFVGPSNQLSCSGIYINSITQIGRACFVVLASLRVVGRFVCEKQKGKAVNGQIRNVLFMEVLCSPGEF